MRDREKKNPYSYSIKFSINSFPYFHVFYFFNAAYLPIGMSAYVSDV